jgi:hypothetical protein
MAKFWLVNTVILGDGTKLLPGATLDLDDIQLGAMAEAGAFVWPVGDPIVDEGGARAHASHVNRGANEVELESIMINSVAKSNNTSPFVLSRTDWYIDADNGRDTNSGVSDTRPLKTVKELARRLGIYGSIKPSGGITTVHLLSDIPTSDPMAQLLVCVPGDTVFQVVSEKETILGTGVITAITPRWDGGDQNQAWEITASGPLAASVGKRAVLTSGPNAGFSFPIVKDLGAGKARCGESVFVDSAANFNGVYFGPPSVGETYKIVEGAKITVGILDAKTGFTDTFLSSWFMFRDVTFRSDSFFPAVSATSSCLRIARSTTCSRSSRVAARSACSTASSLAAVAASCRRALRSRTSRPAHSLSVRSCSKVAATCWSTGTASCRAAPRRPPITV